jgi:hypothetical protein
MTCIEKELDLLSREIFVTEQIDIHLVWTTGRIFLKSIPRFLLEPRFWTDYLSCTRGCRCHKEKVDSRGSDQQCDQRLWKRGAPSQPSEQDIPPLSVPVPAWLHVALEPVRKLLSGQLCAAGVCDYIHRHRPNGHAGRTGY